MTIDRTLEKWETFTHKLVKHFIKKYFEVEDALDVEMYWIGDDVGSVCMINDYFFDMGDIKFCLKNNVKVSKLFEWYDYVVENPDEYINLKSFNMGAEAIIKSRKESLEKSKIAVEQSNKTFNEEVDNYFDTLKRNEKEQAKVEYRKLLNDSGMFFEFYPHLTGDWKKDKLEWFDEYEKLLELRDKKEKF